VFGHGVLALTFGELAGCLAVWEKALEGWNMLESKVVNEWIALGEKRGEARGRVEGEVRGRLTTLQEDILRALEVRFRSPPPEDVRRMVHDQADTAVLRRWWDLALTAGDLNQWRRPPVALTAGP
jgi:hypothetical protein